MNSSSPLLCQRTPQALFLGSLAGSFLLVVGCGISGVISSVEVALSASNSIEDGGSPACFEPALSADAAAAAAVAVDAAAELTCFRHWDASLFSFHLFFDTSAVQPRHPSVDGYFLNSFSWRTYTRRLSTSGSLGLGASGKFCCGTFGSTAP